MTSLLEILNNKDTYNYLINHSYWIIYLKRGDKYIDAFLKEYKKNKRLIRESKISNVIDNIDLINDILKTLN